MEFRFNVNEVFKHPIVEINSSLIPPGLSLADKRALWDAVGKVSDVVNAMGEASATAQGLTKPITSSERLRNSEHKLYLLIDQNANNGKGVVTGMLKTGKKGLYVFDRDGHHYQVQPPCILDFYVHESKQRMGLGKKLYEHMLEKEQVEPVKMAIDRPSDKFLGFLNKHYGLNDPVKQRNNFVVYQGFFPEAKEEQGENNNIATGKSGQPANGLQTNFTSPYGRYGAPRPPCSMGQIIHNQSSLVQPTQEQAGNTCSMQNTVNENVQQMPVTQPTTAPVASGNTDSMQNTVDENQKQMPVTQPPPEPDANGNTDSMQNTVDENLKQMPVTQPATTPDASGDNAETAETVEAEETPIAVPPPQPKLERPQSLSLQTSEDVEGDEDVKGEIQPQFVHTKSNFDIVEDIKKLSVAQNQATPTSKTPDKGDGDAARKTPSHLTEQGFFDLKFYHNKLW